LAYYLLAPTYVTLVPRSQVEQGSATFTDNQVPVRQLSATAAPQNATGNASGSTTTAAAKKAQGTLIFTNVGATTFTVPTTVYTDPKNGVQVTFAGPVDVPAIPGALSVPGIAVQPGAAGNIPQGDIVNVVVARDAQGNVIGQVKNLAFTGGTDAQ
jgi:hypothetical protein